MRVTLTRSGYLVFAVLLAAIMLPMGCGHYLVPGPFQPLAKENQQAPDSETYMEVADDGTVTYVQNRLEISVRPMVDEELNRQFAALSQDGKGPADELPTNAFTYGDWVDKKTGKPPQRFSIFKVIVKNYELPKVKFDPLNVTIESANGRTYYPWGSFDFEEYFRRFPRAFNGLGYRRLEERLGMARRGQYPDDEFCFSGQEVEGYVIFPRIHDDVEEVTFQLSELGLRYNFRNEPVETKDLAFRFQRELIKVRTYEELAVE
ncbi:MAG: hypothetical protein GKR89_05605 [Candidatus Latescibacteria bacterium]|nr:hypothetical protein [Candidatus Latescibacterota bacterium]